MKKVSRSLPRGFWYRVAAALLCSSLSLAWILLRPDSHTIAIQFIGILVALVIGLSGKAARDRSLGSSRLRLAQRWGPLVFVLTTLCPCFGVLVVVYYKVILHQVLPMVSWADFFGLLTYPLMVLYFLLLPTTRLPGSGRIRRMLDNMLILGNCILFSWYFILGPILMNGAEMTPAKLTSIAYPVGTWIIIICFLSMATRTSDPSTRLTILLFTCSILIGSISISIYGYEAIQHTYTPGGVLDLGLQASYILFGLATYTLRLTQSQESAGTKIGYGAGSMQENRPLIPSSLMTFLPYFLLLITIAFVMYCWYIGADGLRENIVYLGSAFLVILSFLRQVFVLRELSMYVRKANRLNQALAEANTRLEMLSTTDPLTKLLNHGALIAKLEQEVEHARRDKHPLSILFFDADHFKHVNDTYGHSVGDEVLKELKSRLQAILRLEDSAGRYGGEEFVLLLPETDLTQACSIAERLRLEVATHPLVAQVVEGGLNVTISIGVATFPTDGETASEVLERADQAMYRAKRLGRNRTQTALQCKLVKQNNTLTATLK